jgi:hypothetical protein
MAEPKKQPQKKEFPVLYEKIVPIILVVFAVIVVGIIIFAAGVALGLFPGW